MTEALLKLGVLIAIFATVFLVSQLGLNFFYSRSAHTRAVNQRLKMLRGGASREEIMDRLRKSAPQDHSNLPPILSGFVQNFERAVMAAALPISAAQILFLMTGAFVLLWVVMLIIVGAAGFSFKPGVLLLATAMAFCIAYVLPLFAFNMMAQRRRRRIEEQFPISLDVFVRALRAGHPIAAAIELLTTEMEDPIGSEYGLVSDEVAYGAELTDALGAMADRWDLEDMRMFVVSISVQSETGGNLAEILQNLSEVIRARAALYMKVRALSSEGRMTGWMLTVLPILTFVGLFLVNPEFYLAVAGDPMFTMGFISLGILYFIGFFWIRKMIDLKV